MSEWKTWSKQFERDMRGAAESVREAFAASDLDAIAGGATEFARIIVECAAAPVGAFLAGLPRVMDVESCKGGRRWTSARGWDDEA